MKVVVVSGLVLVLVRSSRQNIPNLATFVMFSVTDTVLFFTGSCQLFFSSAHTQSRCGWMQRCKATTFLGFSTKNNKSQNSKSLRIPQMLAKGTQQRRCHLLFFCSFLFSFCMLVQGSVRFRIYSVRVHLLTELPVRLGSTQPNPPRAHISSKLHFSWCTSPPATT